MTLLSFFGLCTAMRILAASCGCGAFATVARFMASGFWSSIPVECQGAAILGESLE
jgi:hypothetical protein